MTSIAHMACMRVYVWQVQHLAFFKCRECKRSEPCMCFAAGHHHTTSGCKDLQPGVIPLSMASQACMVWSGTNKAYL